nr:hypothetical protein [Mycobacterium tuberculosis]
MSFPRSRGVFGALAFKCTPDVKARIEEVAAEIGLTDQLPDPFHLENLTVSKNLEVSFPRSRGVFGALAFKLTSTPMPLEPPPLAPSEDATSSPYSAREAFMPVVLALAMLWPITSRLRLVAFRPDDLDTDALRAAAAGAQRGRDKLAVLGARGLHARRGGQVPRVSGLGGL